MSFQRYNPRSEILDSLAQLGELSLDGRRLNGFEVEAGYVLADESAAPPRGHHHAIPLELANRGVDCHLGYVVLGRQGAKRWELRTWSELSRADSAADVVRQLCLQRLCTVSIDRHPTTVPETTRARRCIDKIQNPRAR